ncbi:hypothetical protein [Pseudoalteromonas sp.]|uniref:hypothetical protein n=1 Tax=Pseudoalteromonas sp. TaxID=53249 RepID=UPI002623FC3B|nr:hypothetical protein [Pseudoalteromonas sp.]MCP4587592.1 hypothetical protein [Pseudoalteromonas sp.]
MKIENKGALVEAFAVKSAEIQRLNDELGKAEADLESINQAIVVDEDLLGIIQEGGIHTVNDALVYWNDHNEQLEIAKVIHSWSEKTELNAEQLQLIGGLNE